MQTLTSMHGIPRRGLLRLALAGAIPAWSVPTRACDFTISTLRVTHPWTRASADDATTAVVCMKFDEVSQEDRLVGASTPVAESARIGGELARPTVDFVIPQGGETFLSEKGTYLLLEGLTQPLDVGRAFPLRLVFEKGGEVTANLTVEYARFR